MANIKITDLTAYTDAASTDVLPIVDVGADVTKKITIGNVVKAVPLGTAALPGLAFDGDPNTGIYSPGADQVAISTNGTGRLFVDANGNVGINAASTGAISTGIPVIEIKGNSAAQTDRAGGIRFTRYDGVVGAEIYYADGATYIDSKSTYPLIFYTGGGEKMTLDSSGRLGLGTSNPDKVHSAVQTVLEVASSNGNGSELVIRNNSGMADGEFIGGIAFANNDSGLGGNQSCGIKSFANGTAGYADLMFYAGIGYSSGFDPDVTIKYGGKVGIGTTSPSSLDPGANNLVVGSGSGAEGITIYTGNASRGIINFADGTTGVQTYVGQVAYDHSANALTFGTSAAERARIDSSGRLLVGTSSSFSAGDYSQYSKLQVLGNTAGTPTNGILALGRSEAATTIAAGEDLGIVTFTDNAGNEFGWILCEADGTAGSGDYPGRLVFSVTAPSSASPTEALRISSNRAITVSDGGNVVLGTTTGTKIGTATTQKLGFYNAPPVVQPAAVADATDAATVITQLNDLLAKLRTLGLIAT